MPPVEFAKHRRRNVVERFVDGGIEWGELPHFVSIQSEADCVVTVRIHMHLCSSLGHLKPELRRFFHWTCHPTIGREGEDTLSFSSKEGANHFTLLKLYLWSPIHRTGPLSCSEHLERFRKGVKFIIITRVEVVHALELFKPIAKISAVPRILCVFCATTTTTTTTKERNVNRNIMRRRQHFEDEEEEVGKEKEKGGGMGSFFTCANCGNDLIASVTMTGIPALSCETRAPPFHPPKSATANLGIGRGEVITSPLL